MVLNIPLIFYKSGILINRDNGEFKTYIEFFGVKVGFWETIPRFEYFSITSTKGNISVKGTTENRNITYLKVRLFGIQNDKATLIHKDYFVSRCLDVALFFRESGINIPIYDLTGREEVEY